MTEQKTLSFMGFYYSNALEDWNCDNILEYYRMESGEKERKKLLDYIKKDLQKVEDSVSEFDLTYRKKAREILDKWKEWSIQKKLKRPNPASNVIQVKKIKQYNNLTGDSAIQNIDNRRTISVKRDTKGVTSPTKKDKVSAVVQEQTEKSEIAEVIKKNKVDELFKDMRCRNTYILCGPFRELSELDAEDRFESIVRNTTVKIDIPEDIKKYLHDLLGGDIESAVSKVKEPLNKDARPLLLWTSEVCRHFIFYFYYGGLQTDSDEKTWSNQTVYRILDLFLMFCGKMTSGIALGEIVNEAHKDRIYNINVDQKPANSRRGNRNDAVLYQDNNATIIYEQSFGPTEFDFAHYMGDMTKLARNGIDDLNYHFLQYGNSSVTTAKKLKSVGIHGYKYFISIYLTDLICTKTYRMYEIFKCKVPTSYTDRWFLANITKIGVYLEGFLEERQFVKGEMGKEDTMNEDGPYCVHNWLSIPDNTPEKRKRN